MFRKLMCATVGAVALLAPLTLPSIASAHDFRFDRRVVVRHERRLERPRVVTTVTTVQTIVRR